MVALHRTVLGCERDLAGAGHGPAAGRLSLAAHGVILTALYLPVSVMLLGLILRGVAFEFRAKAPARHKRTWNWIFFAGSDLHRGVRARLHARHLHHGARVHARRLYRLRTRHRLCQCATAYTCIGGAWLVMKTDGELQRRAVRWSRLALVRCHSVAMVAISVATPASEPTRVRQVVQLSRGAAARTATGDVGSPPRAAVLRASSPADALGRPRQLGTVREPVHCCSYWPTAAWRTRSIPTSCRTS